MNQAPDAKALPKLTRKQAEFVRQLVENPKQSATGAARMAYNTESVNGASQIATDNLRKPQIISHLQSASELVENTLTDTVRDWGREDNSRRREIAQNAAMWIHDKVHGKATQRVEVQSTAVTISIDLSGATLPDDVIEGE